MLLPDHASRTTAPDWTTTLPTNSLTSSQTLGARLTHFSLANAQVAKNTEIRVLTWPQLLSCSYRREWPLASSNQVAGLEKARSGGVIFSNTNS